MGDRTQRVKGKANELTGKAKREAGGKTGSRETQAKGAMQETKGKAQEAVGKLSSTVKRKTR